MSVYLFLAGERGGVPLEATTELANPESLVKLMLANVVDPTIVDNPEPVCINPELWPAEDNTWRYEVSCPVPDKALVRKRYVPAPGIEHPEKFGHYRDRIYWMPQVHTFLPVVQKGSPWYQGRFTLTALLVDESFVPESAR